MLLCGGLAAAQGNGVTPPPKVLVIDREYLKPGKGGAPHEKTESAFVQAARRVKEPTHYIAMNSMSGKNRALFVFGFDSFEAWEKENMSVANNASFLQQSVDRQQQPAGERPFGQLACGLPRARLDARIKVSVVGLESSFASHRGTSAAGGGESRRERPI